MLEGMWRIAVLDRQAEVRSECNNPFKIQSDIGADPWKAFGGIRVIAEQGRADKLFLLAKLIHDFRQAGGQRNNT